MKIVNFTKQMSASKKQKTIQPIFIGVVGPSGAGKSTLCKALKLSFKKYEHIRLDNYFKHPKFFPKKFGYPNWESPANLKFKVLLRHLKALKLGKTVQTKSFPKRAGVNPKSLTLHPKKYILIEGFLLYLDKELRNYLDIKIYLDILPKLMLKRRAIRFGAEHINEYDTKVAIPEFLRIGVKVIAEAKKIIEQS
jgi:uridine kinase